MESGLLLIGLLIVLFAVYRLISRRLAGPQSRVRGLLRHYRALEAAGLSEQECLYRILSQRSGWKNLPQAFLGELIKRFKTKEDVFRFVSLAEGYRYDRTHLPGIATSEDLEAAIREIARWLADFGNRLQKQDRLKEAEFVQKLALRLQPSEPCTNLWLATTYYKMERYADALPLFEMGLSKFNEAAAEAASLDGSEAGTDLRRSYEEMYSACLKATGKPSV